MGKVSYRPKRNQSKGELKHLANKNNRGVNEITNASEVIQDLEEVKGKTTTKISISNNKQNQNKLDNIKVIGDLECDYHIYIEDYVYTYIYQLAAADFAKESSAVLVGEIFSDSKEAIVRGVIAIDMDKLQEGSEWLDMGVVQEAEDKRRRFFAEQDIIGWLHMQPGYGTMLTMKELREHQNVFEGDGTICMLVDAINKIETLFVYEENELKEQSGYCMYYERNEEMQQFMLEHPFTSSAKEEMKDTVVNQFREIGKIRKAEYAQRRSLNLTVMAASVILIALTAVIVKMNDQKNALQLSEEEVVMVDSPVMSSDGQAASLLDDSMTGVSSDAVGVENQILLEEGQVSDSIGEAVEVEEQAVEESEDINAAVEQEVSQEKIEYDIYVVETGDTLADICYKAYGNAKRSVEVAEFNDLSNTNQLFVGQELKMPK